MFGASVAVLIAGATVSSATADPITDKKAQAQALAAQIDTLGRKEGVLAEQYDGAVISAQQTTARLQQAEQALAAAQANARRVRAILQSSALDAYVHGGGLMAVASRNGGAGADGLLRSEYLKTLSQAQSDAFDAYHSAVAQQQEAKAKLQAEQKAQNQAMAKVNAARDAASAAERGLEATLAKVKGDLTALVAQVQQAEEAAALRAVQVAMAARQQRQQAAAAATALASRAGGPSAAPAVMQPAAPPASPPPRPASAPPRPRLPAPPPIIGPVRASNPPPAPSPPVAVGSGHGGGAVGAALSRVGDPYVFGGAGPNVFDCSGLVMWAYAQVGVSLPHNAGAQYAMSQHIPMSALQPGDLVFAGGLGHVAMYIGGGMIVEALHTGVPVHVVPMWSFLVLAGRV